MDSTFPMSTPSSRTGAPLVIPTAISASATSTKRPTRNSVQVSCLRCGILAPLLLVALQTTLDSHQKSLQIWIFHLGQLFGTAFKEYFSVTQHPESRSRFPVEPAGSRLFTIRQNFVGRGVKMKLRQRKSVLQPMRSQQRSYSVNIPQTQNQRDDGLRSNRIESRGRRIVQHNGRPRNQCACNGHAAPHASGKFRRQLIDRSEE